MKETQDIYDQLGGTDCLWLCLGKSPGNTVSCDYYYKLKWCKACRGICVFLLGNTAFHILSMSYPAPVFLSEVLAGVLLLKLAEK